DTDRFRQGQWQACVGGVDPQEPLGMGGAGDGHAVFGFGIVDGVSADHRAACLGSDVAAALEDLGEELGGQFFSGPAHQVERHHGGAAHGVDVREGVGGGDAAPVVCVVDHRGEEVRGGQDRQILADLDGGGVVAVVQAYEDFGCGGGGCGRECCLWCGDWCPWCGGCCGGAWTDGAVWSSGGAWSS